MHLVVGRIVRPHGIRGEVIVDVRTDDPDARFTVGATLATSTTDAPPVAGVEVRSGGAESAATGDVAAERGESSPSPEGERWSVPAELTIEAVRAHQGRLIVAFRDVFDRNLAEELRGVLLWVDSARIAAPSDPDEFNDFQLVGLTAVTPEGVTLGEVVAINHAPASDLLVLRKTEGGMGLVPFVQAIVPEVDVPGGRIIVNPPAGLLDL